MLLGVILINRIPNRRDLPKSDVLSDATKNAKQLSSAMMLILAAAIFVQA